jgi:glutathione synthase/RimK-type ligase-like ATP-grasp enzyme
MKKILIISGPYSKADKPRYSKVLSEHMQSFEFTDIKFENLKVEIGPRDFKITDLESSADIKDFDFVFVREYTGNFLDLAFVVSKYLQINKVKFANHDYLNYRPVSKLAQAAIFYELGLAFPEIIFSINNPALLKAAGSLGYPLIAKAAQASHGDNNYLVKTPEELKGILQEQSNLKLLIQKYIPNEHDFRVLVMGGGSSLQIRRRGADDTHLNNTSKGGQAEMVGQIDSDTLSSCAVLAAKIGADIAGIDLLQDAATNNYYFLEINFQPQIISGAYVKEKSAELEKFLGRQLEAGE